MCLYLFLDGDGEAEGRNKEQEQMGGRKGHFYLEFSKVRCS